MTPESISLYYKDAKSDKEYHAQLEATGDGFVVNFQYGRRGGTLTTGTKTSTPVDYAKAKKAYDALVKEKMGKGYTPGEAGSAFTGTSNEERFTGLVPQLLNSITDTEAQALIDDPEWGMQQKFDGHRRQVSASAEEMIGINRKGLAVGLPSEVAAEISKLSQFFPLVLDGELIGSTYIVFDVRTVKGVSVEDQPLKKRLEILAQFRKLIKTPPVVIAETAVSAKAKRILYQHLKETCAEGAVFKKLDSAYVPGRPNSDGNQLKNKFIKSASFIVEQQSASKRSVSLALLDADGKPVNVGKCTIPPNYEVPAVGAVVEVEYLYAYKGGSVYQPVYRGERDDIDQSECLLSQLSYKQGTEEDE